MGLDESGLCPCVSVCAEPIYVDHTSFQCFRCTRVASFSKSNPSCMTCVSKDTGAHATVGSFSSAECRACLFSKSKIALLAVFE